METLKAGWEKLKAWLSDMWLKLKELLGLGGEEKPSDVKEEKGKGKGKDK